MCYTLIRKKFEKYMKIEFFSHSKDETQAIGEKIGKIIARGSVITLDGDLGDGKTTFTQGLGKGLGINDTINSPTFNNNEEIKNVVLFINKNIFPLIFKGYMNQYVGLVLSFNNRIKLINLIVDKIYSITKQKESTVQ